MPSIEAIMITLAGLSCEAPAASLACSAWVRKNGDFRFRSSTLSQPLSGNSSKSAPHAAPALLTRMSSEGSSAPIRAASDLQPSTVEMSCGSEMQVPPPADRRSAVASQSADLREEM
jgi:hypothetical protein